MFIASPGIATAAGPCGSGGVFSGGAPGTTATCTYETAGEDLFTVPAGITDFEVIAIGASGGSGHSGFGGGVGGIGGLGAHIAAPLTLIPGESLYVEVGSSGQNPPEACSVSTRAGGPGGTNGGGQGGDGRCELWGGAGGGGASDLRTTPFASGGLTAAPGDPRLVVAGGGGGAGSGANSNGGDGGDAGVDSIAGAGNGGKASTCEGFGGLGESGFDGGVGAGGGAGGGPGSCFFAQSGLGGQPGIGGTGGNGDLANSAGGGGGGGGYVGGGGGGAQAPMGGGGGGAGSSFGPAGASYETASVSDVPSIAISWTVPPEAPAKTETAPHPPLIVCSAPAPSAAGYVPRIKAPDPRLVPGVRAKIKVTAPARLQIGAVLAYRLNGKALTTDLGIHTLDNPRARNIRLALPVALRKQLSLGTKVKLQLTIADAASCGSPQQLTVATRVVKLQPNT